jgi:aminoglycoside/choline kinase family phosphotransferase
MAPLGCLSVEWYALNAKGTDNAKAELELALFAAIEATEIATPVLVLRDYHAENLLWTPMFEAPKNIGLLDFQDARVGQPTYDLVSLLGDARRDVSKPVRKDLLQYYQSKSGIGPDKFSASCAAQSAQRNLRIIGVFARLCIRDGKPSYLDFIPRVWANLKQDLQHPSLSSVAQTVFQNIPEPTPEILNLLRRKCPTNHH